MIVTVTAFLGVVAGFIARGFVPMGLDGDGGSVSSAHWPPITCEAFEAVNRKTSDILSEVLGDRRSTFYHLKAYPESGGLDVLIVHAASTRSVSDSERDRIFDKVTDALGDYWSEHPPQEPRK